MEIKAQMLWMRNEDEERGRGGKGMDGLEEGKDR